MQNVITPYEARHQATGRSPDGHEDQRYGSYLSSHPSISDHKCHPRPHRSVTDVLTRAVTNPQRHHTLNDSQPTTKLLAAA